MDSLRSSAIVTIRYHSLDVWRGIACLMVIVIHSSYYIDDDQEGIAATFLKVIRKGWWGVPMFFVISGFCIAGAADSNRRTGAGARKHVKFTGTSASPANGNR
jgi:peptidoglycan/LPS O-acetylase OafA/YrhL